VGEGRQGGRYHGGLSSEQLSGRLDHYLLVSDSLTARSCYGRGRPARAGAVAMLRVCSPWG
jgi:hypothetical protein